MRSSDLRARLLTGLVLLFGGLLLGYSALGFTARERASAAWIALAFGALLAIAGLWMLARR